MDTVKEIEWSPKWDGGAPMPQVFANGQKVYLTYILADWSNKTVTPTHTLEKGSENSELIAIVEFAGHTFRFGIANDEVFSGLPLYKKGLNKWAHIVENSSWIDEIRKIHSIHPYYNTLGWTKLNHYALLFKDEMLEVIASGYKIEVYNATYNAIGNEIINRMNRR